MPSNINIALENKFPVLEKTINPLENDLVWIRGMDVNPISTTSKELENMKKTLESY